MGGRIVLFLNYFVDIGGRRFLLLYFVFQKLLVLFSLC